MGFYEILDQVVDLLRRRGRVTYRALKREFQVDDAFLEDLKAEIIIAQRLAVDEQSAVLVWVGEAGTPPAPQEDAYSLQGEPRSDERRHPEAERRQLTVLFCDLVDSTPLSSQLDPEDWREVVRAYQEACAKVVGRFEGQIAQYLGDGLLVYFGYPLAHEDDAQRAVRAGLGMIEAVGQLNTRLAQERGVHLAVRLGLHTGLVVVGEVGGGTRQEQLALGETPNLAARLQGLAAPNTLVISAATLQLLGGFFAYQSLGTPLLKGFAQPLEVYQVLSESTARSRLDVASSTGLTPLVGREQEVGLLLERWTQVKDGRGQVVLLSGEAGIGKSRLVQVLKEHVAAEPQAWLTPCQCSPYHQNSALYPLIDALERVALQFERDETSQQKLSKLEGYLVQYGLPLAEAVPLFASLLSLPLGSSYAPLHVSPEQQKQKTLQAILTILLRRAAQQPLLFVVEDLHWVDPSTLELLSLLVDQGPTARILTLFTFRPDFPPPWTGRSHLTQVMLHRLTPRQAAEMTDQVAHRKALPTAVVEQVVAKTDGVPLFVEELTKMVLESGLLREREEHYELTGSLPPLAIPATLHDSLMARLDRLATVKGLAQLGATLGREFSYELLQAVSPWDEATVQRGLQQLLEAEFLYQQGLPPQATYLFKHALIQDAAYQSLLRSTRQRYHQRVAQVLEARFPEICETQPELVAYHYTEASLAEQAIPHWQRAGERASERSAYVEAIGHLTTGLAALEALPDTPERTHQALALHLVLGPPLVATKGYAAPEVERVYARARVLCQHVGETPQLFPVLRGLGMFYLGRADYRTAQEFGEQLLTLAQRQQAAGLLLEAHFTLGMTLFYRGELTAARVHLEQGIALYDAQQHRTHTALYGHNPGVACLCFAAWTLSLLGYLDQALQRIRDALTLAQELSHPHSLVWAIDFGAIVHHMRREWLQTRERAEAVIALASEQGYPLWVAAGTCFRGSALLQTGQVDEAITQIRQGLSFWQGTGAALARSYFMATLAEAYGKNGQYDEGWRMLAEALEFADTHGDRFWEAELYRLRGELLLQQTTGRKQEDQPPPEPSMLAEAEHSVRSEAAACFQQALTVARRQQAKSLELRAAISLSRLWQHQGKPDDARHLLAEIYGWFTEVFDTADRREAKAVLEELS
jgi:predicted ATPase/class 3 adenylate cyclase